MTTLAELADPNRTDKNTLHSYLDTYEKLLSGKKESAKNVLEVGIYRAGSIKMWHDYFPNAQVYGLDIMHYNDVWDGVKNNNRITLFTSTDAYNQDFFNNHFLSKNIKCDFMLDDGPHTLESMKAFIIMYSKLMTDDGILIVEDVQAGDWIPLLKKVVPEELQQYIEVYDLRENKDRYDDLVFVINKSKKV